MGENIPTNMVISSMLHDADVKYNELDGKDKDESSSCSEDSSSSDDTSSSDFESEDGDIVEEFNKLDFGDLLLSSTQRVNLRKLFKPGEFESLCRFDQKRISRIENKLTLALRLDIIREKIGLPRQISHPLEASDSDSDAESSRYPTLLRGLSVDETAARMSFIAKYCEERESGKRIVCQKMKRKKVLKPTEPQRIVADEKPKFEAFKEVSTYRTRGTRNIPYAEPYLPEDDHFVYCEDCQKSFLDDCPDHPLTIMKDSDAKEGAHDYARRTCPPGLSIDPSSVYNAGYGVWADVAVPKNTVFGPYKGCIVGRYDVKHLMKVCSGGYSWEVYRKSKLSHYIDGSDASKSNWMRFINCARYQEEQNLVAFQYRGEIYYRSFCDIKPNTEMFVWYGSQFASQLGIQGSLKQKFCPATSNESAISEPVSRDQQGYGTEISDIPKSDHADVKNDSCSPSRESVEKSYSDFAMQGHAVVAKDEELTTQPVLQMTQADQIPFKCDTCGRRYRRRDALTYHIRTHTGERPFKCEICGFRFNRKGGLTAHKMIHTGEKPFKCMICGARFRRRDGLVSHKLTHTGVKPFKCDKCGSGFFRKDGLKNHKRIHTDCGARFRDGRDLRSHERTDTASDIVREIQGQLMMEKGLATFTAEVENDGITGYWTKDGVVLQCSEKFQILSEHRVRQLIIINVSEDDSGEYSFHTGRSKTSGKITVQAVGIKSQLEPVTIKETQTAVFECTVSHMDIMSNVNCWTKNGSRIQNTDRISANVEGNKHTLSIRDCTAEDSGRYAFHIGKDKSEAKLEVKAVEMVRKLEGQLIMVKRCATFTAEVDTDRISGYWTKDGVVLQSSEKFQMHVERRVHQLTIGNICENDSGIYSFHAGGSKTSGRLTVQAVSITSQIKPVTIKETQTAVFECIISHPDITSHMKYWTKNGTRIQNTDRISTNVQGCKHTLSIWDCTTEDSGQYAFQVGKDKSEAKLHVQAIDIARELEGQFNMEKKLAIFTAEVDNDGITGYWTKDSVILQTSDKFQMQVERRVHQLTIANVCENDAGEYFFHAGRSKTSGRLTVQTVSIKSQLKPVTIKETQTAVFECTVSHPDIMSDTSYWTKDKSQIQVTH